MNSNLNKKNENTCKYDPVKGHLIYIYEMYYIILLFY